MTTDATAPTELLNALAALRDSTAELRSQAVDELTGTREPLLPLVV